MPQKPFFMFVFITDEPAECVVCDAVVCYSVTNVTDGSIEPAAVVIIIINHKILYEYTT